MLICQQCQREVPSLNQGKFCPFCGALLPEAEPAQTGAAPAAQPTPASAPAGFSPISPDAGDSDSAPGYVAWEHRDRLGFLQAFSQTWSDATFRPQKFFRAAPKTGNVGSALLYAFLVGMAASLISAFWQYQLYGSFGELEEFERIFGMGWNREMMRYVVLASPFFLVVSIFVGTAIFHVCLVLVGSGKNGWEATFRALCYSYGPQFLSIIPWCGGVIAALWQLVIVVIGGRELHESSTGRVVLALLLPLFLCCCVSSFLVYRFAEWFSRLGLDSW